MSQIQNIRDQKNEIEAQMAEAHIVFKLVKVACYGQEGDRWADAVELVRSRPWAAKVVDNTRGAVSWLVLHWLCAYAAPCYALEAVLELHPKASDSLLALC